MTGQALYELWCRANDEQGRPVNVDWTHLTQHDRAAWVRTAELLWGGE